MTHVDELYKLLEVYSLEEILTAADMEDKDVLAVLVEQGHIDLDNLELPKPL
jgi:hypothetical protein